MGEGALFNAQSTMAVTSWQNPVREGGGGGAAGKENLCPESKATSVITAATLSPTINIRISCQNSFSQAANVFINIDKNKKQKTLVTEALVQGDMEATVFKAHSSVDHYIRFHTWLATHTLQQCFITPH